MDLNELAIFARVVQDGSFTAAARALDMPKSTVSRKVSELERRLGSRLLQRTTRKLSLTDAGRTYFQYAARIVDDVEEAEAAVTRMQDAPRGLLRITAPLDFGYLGGIVASFLLRFPEVEVDLVCSDRVIDLVADGYDVAVRAGRLADSSLIARQLGSLENVVVASPAFVDAHGAPAEPARLSDLPALVFGAGSEGGSWRLQCAGRQVSVALSSPRFVANDFDMLRAAAVAGVGVAMLPIHRCIDALRDGRLRRLLPDWSSPEIPIHALYPSTRHLAPKIRAFVDHLGERMTPPPWELGPAA